MSVRKRQWTTPTGETRESWVVDYLDQAGRRHIKTFPKKKDADAYHAQARVEVARGEHTADSQSITVAEAARRWIETCKARGLERSTVEAYERQINFHIVPLIGSVKLSQFSAPMVRDFEDRLRQGGEESGAPRSSAMLRKIIGSLGALIADAQERGLINRNVVREIRGRRQRGAERRADKRQKGKLQVGVDIPTRDEIRKIVEHLTGRWRPMLITAVFAGLRSSELRGLRWSDVDLKSAEVHVRQRVDQYREFGPPKSEAGERTIPIPPMLVNVLREWRLKCPKGDLDLVFPTGKGTPESHANVINRGLIPAQIAAGVTVESLTAKNESDKPVIVAKYTGLHALRHFYASWCINSVADGGLGLSAKAAQVRLGHSSIVMTLDVYGHLFPRDDTGAELAAAERSLLG
ncbi:site-specific integrase [Rhodoblastus sp.]|uniref:site-specific integrase n=1 Tax=Rhodoblastus sp. TaxID=1962975 RepID=UPI003F944FCB